MGWLLVVNFISVLNNIYKMILENETIGKVLYHPSDNSSDAEDPLGKAVVAKDVIVNYIKKTSSDYIINSINKSNNPVKRGYITIFAEDYVRMDNPYASSAGVRIEIYMPVRKFEEYQWRLQIIVSELNKMFQQKNITGSLGRLVLDSSFNFTPPIDGYVGYTHIFSAGNMVT